MATCASCGCDLPGVETLCRDCYYQQYWQVNAPRRTFWQRLGQNGPEWLLAIGVWVIAVPLYYALARVPRLLHAIQFLYQVFLGGIVWVLMPWLLIKEWKAERTRSTLFLGVVFIVQLICVVLWWTSGDRLWFQIGMAVAVPLIIYGKLARAFRFLWDL